MDVKHKTTKPASCDSTYSTKRKESEGDEKETNNNPPYNPCTGRVGRKNPG